MSQDPLINQVLGGARLQQRVSKGLLAHVYRGHYERLGIPVAVKVLSPKATAQGMNRERFVREGRALAQLAHQNIIKIYNVGHENGRFFIIMDWIQDGMNLRQLAQSRPLTPAQSLKVVQRMCEALDYIHQKGLIHRDVKPANVCLRRGGHPVLMDFSLIKDQQSDVQLTAPGTIMGTVNFMPPEQAQPGGAFGDVSARSDVYSLGGCLYWLLTGKPPFKGRTPMETIIKLMREQPQPPSAHNPSLPPVVDELVLKTLSKNPNERPASARDLANRLEHIFQNNRPELDAAQRPALAGSDDGTGRQPARPAKPAAPQPKPAASWGSGSSPDSQKQPAAAVAAPAAATAPAQQPAHVAAAASQQQPVAAGPAGRAIVKPAAKSTATPFAAPPGLGSATPEPEPADDMPQHDDGEGGDVFVPTMSTEGAAAGMLKLPDELREDFKAPQGESRFKFILLIVLLTTAIVGGLTTAVLVLMFDWKFW